MHHCSVSIVIGWHACGPAHNGMYLSVLPQINQYSFRSEGGTVSKRETIDAFIRGDIDRRTFMSRLATLGVSSGAALAYATTFGNSAVASTGSSASGFVTQFQGDLDYGVPGDPGPLDEVIAIISEVFAELESLFEGLADFLPDDFAEGIFDALTQIQEQLALQLEALAALLGTTRSTSTIRQFAAAQGTGDPDAFLQSLATALDDLTARFAFVVPAVEEPAARQTMMNVAMVTGRHAGFVNWAAGNDPFPSAFQEPAIPQN